ncbi:hypothetical protein DL96DRAFT_1639723 [Flagelloscypha sp. PMI_526]|nr:hypothetical protein DL96DRAFT_1639723 [Flagelloscypha sp. PMI_526]
MFPRWFLYVVPILYCVHLAGAAFSLPSSFYAGYVQQDNNKTWCYYPVAGITRAVNCGGDYTFILGVHLNTTTSLGYYQPDGTRSGGAEWTVPVTNPGLIFLCGSGRAGDGTYQTFCGTPVTADNAIPGFSGDCVVAIAQTTVTDGCYMPGQLPFVTDASSLPSSIRATGSTATTTLIPSHGSRTRSCIPLEVVILAVLLVSTVAHKQSN